MDKDKLPRSVGGVTIVWGSERRAPDRKGNRIYLPYFQNMEFFSLMDGKQFVVAYPEIPYPDFPSQGFKRTFFGGVDDGHAFFTELDSGFYFRITEALGAGEQKFYALLKPSEISDVEKVYGFKSIRQGDWYAIPFPYSLSVIKTAVFLFDGEEKLPERKVEDHPIGGTRHRFTGSVIDMDMYVKSPKDGGEATAIYSIYKGVLKSPSHKPLRMRSYHILEQSSLLNDAPSAD